MYNDYCNTKFMEECMKNTRGRPTDNPKEVLSTVRLSAQDTQKRDYCCQQTEKSKSEIIRMGINKVYDELKNQ